MGRLLPRFSSTQEHFSYAGEYRLSSHRGNNTSLLEYIETKLEEKVDVPMGVKEIQNIESAMDFIENNVKSIRSIELLSAKFIEWLSRDYPLRQRRGGQNSSQYRKSNLQITNLSIYRQSGYSLMNIWMNYSTSSIRTAAQNSIC